MYSQHNVQGQYDIFFAPSSMCFILRILEKRGNPTPPSLLPPPICSHVGWSCAEVSKKLRLTSGLSLSLLHWSTVALSDSIQGSPPRTLIGFNGAC